ncbi:DUF3703 domain-containing protein [Sphingorhabdus lutea]|nr:DUF3703 domain-containing protein [Sphingorhabdus lutea]
MIKDRRQKFQDEISAYREARSSAIGAGRENGSNNGSKNDNIALAWLHLERAHILGQAYFFEHLHVHWLMLCFAVSLWDFREIGGQVFRLILAPLGNITGRLPMGNNGRSHVSAFAPMEIPDDLRFD